MSLQLETETNCEKERILVQWQWMNVKKRISLSLHSIIMNGLFDWPTNSTESITFIPFPFFLWMLMLSTQSMILICLPLLQNRLRNDTAGGAWCPHSPVGPANTTEWIQVNLGQTVVVTGIATQGRYGGGRGIEFTDAYRILYSRQRIPTKWIVWKSWNGRSVSGIRLCWMLLHLN